MNRTEFIAGLIDRFPVIKEEVLHEDYSHSISLQMVFIKRFIQEAIDHDNNELAKAIFDFLEAAVANVTSDVENSNKQILREKFGAWIHDKKVLVLDIPDEYGYMDPELVEILERHWEDMVG